MRLGKLRPPYLSMGGAALLAVAVATALRPLGDPDLWWLLWAGDWFLAHGDVPRANLLSYTAPDHPWVCHEWGVALLYALLRRLAGYASLRALKTALLALAWALLHHLLHLRTGRHRVTLPLLLAGFPFFWSASSTRPLLFGLLLFELELWVLARERSPWLLVPLQLLWVQLHGTFPLGGLLLGTVLLQRLVDRRPWRQHALVLGTFPLLALLNPYGTELLRLSWQYAFPPPGSVFERLQDVVEEWRPPQLGNPLDVYRLLLALLLGLAIALPKGRRERLGELLLWAALLWVSVHHRRGFLPLGVFALPAAAPGVERLLERAGVWLRRHRPGLAGALARRARAYGELERANTAPALPLALAFAISLLLFLPGDRASQLDPDTLSEPLLERLASEPPRRLFNAFQLGAFLAYNLGRPVFYDSRNDAYPREVLDDFLHAHYAVEGWPGVLERWEVEEVVERPSSPLAEALRADPGWRLDYEDRVSVVFLRAGEPPEEEPGAHHGPDGETAGPDGEAAGPP